MHKFVAVVVLAMYVTLAFAAGAIKQPMIGSPAPPYKIQSVDGKSLALSDLRGKVVVLHFGAGW